MQLQKLVYFAHGWHLALKGEPLINTPVKAWNFGPVIPPLYNALKKYGAGAVLEPISRRPDQSESAEEVFQEGFLKRLIERVWEVYGHMTEGQLSALTHQPGEPWTITYQKTPFEVIPDDLIKAHFAKQLKPAA